MSDLREIQARAWANKRARGFNLTDVAYEITLLVAEIGELIDAWRKNRPRRRWWHWLFRIRPRFSGGALEKIASELADVVLFVVAIAQMLGIDLQAAVEDKMAVNESRRYRRMPNGVHVKTTGLTGESAPDHQES